MKGRMIEIFSSIQGEGLWVGRPQVFVRFHGCHLKCQYCDTPLTHHKIHECRIEYPAFSGIYEHKPLELTTAEINEQIARFKIPSLAVTGGEPLEQVDFLYEWFRSLDGKYEILLETSGIEVEALGRVIFFVDLVSLDIKIPSATGEEPYWEAHDRFIQCARQKPHYAKVVYDERMTDDEIERVRMILNKYTDLSAVFQPVSPIQKRDMKRCLRIFELFSETFSSRVRLIPQIHKFLSIL